MEKVFVIILNYNGWKDTVDCINSFEKNIDTAEYEYQITVIDNNSTDDSFEKLKELLAPDIILIKTDHNGGYAYGNNIGIKYAAEHGADYLCILNNDTIITDDFFPDIIELLKKDPTIAFAGPMLVNNTDDLVQSTGGRVSIVKGKSYELNKKLDYHSIPSDIFYCDIIFGAAMLFRADIINAVGLIPEEYFLFYEETEWCYKARKSGYKNACVTTKKIRHKGSASLKNMNKMQVYLMERNRTLFVKRNGSLPQFIAFLVYDFGRTVYRAIAFKAPFMNLIKYHYDGLIERFDKNYVKVLETKSNISQKIR